jgi:hypothetical protein
VGSWTPAPFALGGTLDERLSLGHVRSPDAGYARSSPSASPPMRYMRLARLMVAALGCLVAVARPSDAQGSKSWNHVCAPSVYSGMGFPDPGLCASAELTWTTSSASLKLRNESGSFGSPFGMWITRIELRNLPIRLVVNDPTTEAAYLADLTSFRGVDLFYNDGRYLPAYCETHDCLDSGPGWFGYGAVEGPTFAQNGSGYTTGGLGNNCELSTFPGYDQGFGALFFVTECGTGWAKIAWNDFAPDPVIPPLDLSSAELILYAEGWVNRPYTICNTGTNCLSVATTTPEPATFALLGTGVLGLGIVAKRRRKA